MFDLDPGAGMADVFVSYKHVEKDRVKAIVQALKDLGLTVWFDPEIPAGEAYEDVIKRELAEAKAVLVCWSKAAVESVYVKSEATRARNRGTIVPCFLEPCELPFGFEFTQTEDMSTWAGEQAHPGWRKAIETIAKLVGRPGLPGLVDALADGSDAQLLTWAQRYPDDPYANGVWGTVERKERQKFEAQIRNVREALSEAMKLMETTKQRILEECEAAFEKWVAEIKTAPYESRPSVERAISASEASLETMAVAQLAAERDAARAESKRLALEIENARASTPTPPVKSRKSGALIAAAALLGAVFGAGGIAQWGATSAPREELEKLRREVVAVAADRDAKERALNATNGELEDARAAKARAEARANGAEEALRAIRSSSTEDFVGLRSEVTKLTKELSQTTTERDLALKKASNTAIERDAAVARAAKLEEKLAALEPTKSAAPAEKPRPTPSQSDDGMCYKMIRNCVLEVGGRQLINASPCSFGSTSGCEKSAPGREKKMSISGSDGKYTYRASLSVKTSEGGRKSADGYLEGGKTATARPLGELAADPSDPACWVNRDGSVRWCATK
jgi:hypothetical protein